MSSRQPEKRNSYPSIQMLRSENGPQRDENPQLVCPFRQLRYIWAKSDGTVNFHDLRPLEVTPVRVTRWHPAFLFLEGSKVKRVTVRKKAKPRRESLAARI
jgi:hypothetical protein